MRFISEDGISLEGELRVDGTAIGVAHAGVLTVAELTGSAVDQAET